MTKAEDTIEVGAESFEVSSYHQLSGDPIERSDPRPIWFMDGTVHCARILEPELHISRFVRERWAGWSVIYLLGLPCTIRERFIKTSNDIIQRWTNDTVSNDFLATPPLSLILQSIFLDSNV